MGVTNIVLRSGVGGGNSISGIVLHGLGDFSGGGTALAASPTSIVPGSINNVITLTGTGTTWTPGTPGSPTFSISSTGSNAAKTAQTVASTTGATITLTAGTPGVITITDPSTGATATVTVSGGGGSGGVSLKAIGPSIEHVGVSLIP